MSQMSQTLSDNKTWPMKSHDFVVCVTLALVTREPVVSGCWPVEALSIISLTSIRVHVAKFIFASSDRSIFLPVDIPTDLYINYTVDIQQYNTQMILVITHLNKRQSFAHACLELVITQNEQMAAIVDIGYNICGEACLRGSVG